MTSANGITAFFLNFLGLGAGYAYSGRFYHAALTLLGTFTLLFLITFLAAFSPWFVLIGLSLALAFALLVALDSIRWAQVAELKPHWIYASLYIVLFASGLAFLFWPSQRVMFYSMSSKLMEPTFVRGDHFALDRNFSDFKNGDVVAAEMEDQSLNVRRIQEIKATSVILTTDSKTHMRTEEVPLTALRGKVLYVLYSVDPESWATKRDRFFLPVH